jgi:hypothetical protein
MMALQQTKNLVSQPPLNSPVVDSIGMLNKSWAIFFRDIYNRVGYKGGNAIDENKAINDAELLVVSSSLEETIVQVNENIDGISTNVLSIQANTDALSAHELLEEAHGSNGVIVGFDDLADETTQGLVKRMTVLADAIASTAGVAVADASVAPAAYSQAHSQELVDLSNANKAAINTLVTDFNNAVIVLNNLIALSKTSGQMSM